jgi:hypothetical protein
MAKCGEPSESFKDGADFTPYTTQVCLGAAFIGHTPQMQS